MNFKEVLEHKDILGLKQPKHIHTHIRCLQRANMLEFTRNPIELIIVSIPLFSKWFLKLDSVRLIKEFRTLRQRMRLKT